VRWVRGSAAQDWFRPALALGVVRTGDWATGAGARRGVLGYRRILGCEPGQAQLAFERGHTITRVLPVKDWGPICVSFHLISLPGHGVRYIIGHTASQSCIASLALA